LAARALVVLAVAAAARRDDACGGDDDDGVGRKARPDPLPAAIAAALDEAVEANDSEANVAVSCPDRIAHQGRFRFTCRVKGKPVGPMAVTLKNDAGTIIEYRATLRAPSYGLRISGEALVELPKKRRTKG
jgi:hypothetical protein